MDVISIGETMVLFTPEAPGQLRYSRNYSSKIAGAETNTLIGLSKLGHRTGWIGQVGADEFGAFILSTVRGEGVDTSQVLKNEKAPTGVFFKELLNEDNVRIQYYRKGSAASFIAPDQVSEDYLAKAQYLYLTGITPALSESCKEAVFYAIEAAKRLGKTIVFDPNIRHKLWGDEEARKTLLAIVEKVDIMLPGVAEGEFLFGTKNVPKMAEHLHKRGVKTVVMKLGKKGAYLSTEFEQKFIPGFKVSKVVDPVGAGDGFSAGFLSGLLDGLSLEESVKRACAVGAMVITVSGDIEGLPDRERLDDFMRASTTAERVSR
ncbi:sugar kinase [Pullulanibacillus sp. KACC 23026]|uniref:sugar kinase n=1 Tax=Pullulanibacillus sp. KACC 23026 TaxID=3028315 RepID=UPI0023AEE18C|nr:sugar kinase [Pullulanibacillus sp. KACC 23026]WEG13314.1 sugar kinase [Pullulanibacillus sp. KACC 23026]